MEIQTDITKQDLIDFNLYHLSHSATAKRQRWLWILPGLCWSGIWLSAAWTTEDPLRSTLALMPLIMGGPLAILGTVVLWKWHTSRHVDKFLSEGSNRAILGPQLITLTEDAISAANTLSQSTTRWQAIERVAATEESIYIYTNALAAIVVPRRAFPNEATFREFADTAKRYHTRATT